MRINELPREIQNLFLYYLCPSELARAAQTCRLWRALSDTHFKRHYNTFPYVPAVKENWLRAYSEKMKIVNNLRKNRFRLIHYAELPLHKKFAWIEKVKKDTVLPITGFGDYFSYAELNAIRLNQQDYLTLDCDESGALVYASSFVLYYYTGQNYAIYAPLKHSFRASLKAIVLGQWDFLIPTLCEGGGIQVFRFLKGIWTKLIFIENASVFRFLHDQGRMIVQVSEREIQVYPLHFSAPQYRLFFDEPIRFFKVDHGLLHTFSGSVCWQAHDTLTGKLEIDTSYRVKNARFLTQRKLTQIVTRKTIACKTENMTTLIEIDLPPFAKIIKAILAERLVIFCYSFRESFYVEAYDLLKRERIKLSNKKEFVFSQPINLYYENGYLLCHSRLFEIASLFNFRIGIV